MFHILLLVLQHSLLTISLYTAICREQSRSDTFGEITGNDCWPKETCQLCRISDITYGQSKSEINQSIFLRFELIIIQDWDRQFSEESLAAATGKMQLKRLPTVEVRLFCSTSSAISKFHTHFLQDVADQIVLFAKSRSITGTNALIDCGFSL